MEVQTRSEINGLKYYTTVAQAMEEAAHDASIWKISFEVSGGERVRLVRNEQDEFVYQDLTREVLKAIGQKVV